MFVIFLFYLVVFFMSSSTTTCFALFDDTFLFRFPSLSSKSVFFMKLPISFLLVKFGCANLAVKFSAVNLLNSGVVIYLS